MSNIFLISCIIAVTCVDFRQAEPLNFFSPLDQLNKGFQGAIKEGTEHIRHIEEGANKLGETLNTRLVDETQRLKNLGTGILQGITANNSACSRVIDDVQSIISQKLSMVETCLSKGTELAGVNIQDLIQSIQDIFSGFLQRAQAVMQCFQNVSTDVKDAASCFANALNPQLFAQLASKMIQVFLSISRLYMSFPAINSCFIISNIQSGPQQLITLMSDVAPCVQSLMIRLG